MITGQSWSLILTYETITTYASDIGTWIHSDWLHRSCAQLKAAAGWNLNFSISDPSCSVNLQHRSNSRSLQYTGLTLTLPSELFTVPMINIQLVQRRCKPRQAGATSQHPSYLKLLYWPWIFQTQISIAALSKVWMKACQSATAILHAREILLHSSWILRL